MSEAMDQVATDVLADLMGVEVDEAPAEGEQPEEVAAPEAHEANDEPVEALDFDPQLPEEVAEFLDEPDFEPTAEEVEAVEVPEVNDDAEEWDDDEVAKLKRELAKERKRREHAEQLRVSSQRSTWEKEAKKYFPLSEPALASINASSRRAYLRAAREAHETMKPFVQKFITDKKAEAEAAREAAMRQAKEDAKAAWGDPLTGPGAPSDKKAAVEEIEKARSTGSLVQVMKAHLKRDGI